MIFAEGQRPTADTVERALASLASPAGGLMARVSHRPDGDAGWLELLASGLTFDIAGLLPAAAADLPLRGQVLGLPDGGPAGRREAVGLVPGPHVSDGGALLPVVRVLCGLGAGLARTLSAQAVCWTPARTWMAPDYFARIVDAWLAGGAFPALGLTSIAIGGDGMVGTTGLAFFIGQELRFDPGAGEAPANAVKLAVRIVDTLVRHGPVLAREELSGPDGEELVAEPDAGGGLIVVRRSA